MSRADRPFAVAPSRVRDAVRGIALRAAGPRFAQTGLPLVLIVYLGLRGGGYDEVVRGEVGLAAWWIVLFGAAVGALPVARPGRGAWIALGAFAALAVWTALGIGWSESAERSVAEVGRVASLLGVFALAVSIQTPGAPRRVVSGLALGIFVIGAVALLSRLHPAWFPELTVPKTVFEAHARLHFPLDYWNGLGALMAMGIPLLLAVGTFARNVAVRTLAAAAIPVLALTLFFTLSRGGFLELAIALLVLLAVHPHRVLLVITAIPPAIGAAILAAAGAQRNDLSEGLATTEGLSQGNEMLAMTLVVCAGVALLSAAVAIATRHGFTPSIPSLSKPRRRLLVGMALAGTVVALFAGGAGAVADRWEAFKDPGFSNIETSRFDSASGSGRYQWWSSAAEANATDPLIGIGPGAFEFWWAREGEIPGFIRDAHSLYLETFAELGIVGLVLVLGIIAAPFVAGARRLRGETPEGRMVVAAALAACAAFAVAAALEWVWELTVLPVAFLILSATLAARPPGSAGPARKAPGRTRLALAALAATGLVAVSIPLAGAVAVRDSQADVRAMDLPSALSSARTAADIQPWAATPKVQEALVLELQGEFDGAVLAAREATSDEPTNWRNWLVLSRLEAKAGNPTGSVEAYREARALNPRSTIFQ